MRLTTEDLEILEDCRERVAGLNARAFAEAAQAIADDLNGNPADAELRIEPGDSTSYQLLLGSRWKDHYSARGLDDGYKTPRESRRLVIGADEQLLTGEWGGRWGMVEKFTSLHTRAIFERLFTETEAMA